MLGRRTVELLCAEGHTVRALARSRGAAARLAEGTAIVGDVWDEGFLRLSMAGADAVLMLATSIPDGPSALLMRGWRENDRIRSRLAPTVARTAREQSVPIFVQESVLFVYPDSGTRWVDESTPLDPSRQARTSVDAEAAARDFQAHTATGKSVVLRFGLFAAGDSGLSRQMWRMATKGRAMTLGDLEGYTSQVHVHDAAAAVVAALRPEVAGGTYNVSAEPTTKARWLESLSDLAGREVQPPPPSVRNGLPHLAPITAALARSIRLDSTALTATGWEPRYPTVEAIWSAVGAMTD